VRRSPMLWLPLSALCVASPSSAAFSGLTSQYEGSIGGKHVWRVYAVSDNANDMLFAAFGHHVLSGSMESVEHNDPLGGNWAPHLGSAEANDSFVTITGGIGVGVMQGTAGTVLTSGWITDGTGSEITNTSGEYGGASWQISDAASAVRAGTGLFVGGMYRVMIMQIAGTNLSPNGVIGFNARVNLAWWSDVGSAPDYLFNSLYSVPTPGAVVLAGLGSFCGRGRRRSSR